MSRWIAAGFVVLGLIHAPAALGAVSPDALVSLYGPMAAEPGLRIVLQHRGAIFALITLGCFVAAAVPYWQLPVAILTGWSMGGFLLLYVAGGIPAGPLWRIAVADMAGLAVLLGLGLAFWRGAPWRVRSATR